MENQQPYDRETVRRGCAISTAGGLLAVIAFFCPWFVVSVFCGQAVITPSLITEISSDYLVISLAWLPAALACVLIILSIVLLRRPSFVLAICHLITSVAGLLATFLFTIAVATAVKISDFLAGFWLTLLGFLIALVGSIFVILGANCPQRNRAYPRARNRDWE